jgi:hypothetical protein
MKHTTLLTILLAISCTTNLQAQSSLTIGTGAYVTGNNTFGIMRSGDIANSWNRNAYIYPASLFSSIPIGSSITSLEFYAANISEVALPSNATFKLYVKNIANADFGSANLSWSTEIATASLVYNGTPSSIVGTESGYKKFIFSTPLIYTGGSLEVLVEYVQTTAPMYIIYWSYDDEQGVPAYTVYQGKYNNGTGSLTASLSNSSPRHPNMKVNYSALVPLNILSFSGEAISNKATLNWKFAGTAADIENVAVEKSTDQTSWSIITKLLQKDLIGSTAFSCTDIAMNSANCYYRLKVTDKSGKYYYSSTILLHPQTSIGFSLGQNTPNPFRSTAQVSYQLSKDSKVLIELYNLLGKKVATLVSEQKKAGSYSFMIDTMKYQLGSGTYSYRMLLQYKDGKQEYSSAKWMVVQ